MHWCTWKYKYRASFNLLGSNNIHNAVHYDNFTNLVFDSVDIFIFNSNMHTEFCSTTVFSNCICYLGQRAHVSNIENTNVCVPRRSFFFIEGFFQKMGFAYRVSLSCYENWTWNFIFQIFRNQNTPLMKFEKAKYKEQAQLLIFIYFASWQGVTSFHLVTNFLLGNVTSNV